MNKFGVTPEKDLKLQSRMAKLKIKENDLIEKFVRSSGAGGQHLNKTSSCVFLKHLPSGIEVKCQKERSQALNRFHARQILCERIENMVLGNKSSVHQKHQKVRKQKDRRKRKAKTKISATQ